MPFDNWQFWIVTMIVLIAVYVLIRPFVSRGKKNGSCCGSATKPKKTNLTIRGKRKS
jgi:hypothetical protein